jgi:branched-chain amino acid transport system permease protein
MVFDTGPLINLGFYVSFSIVFAILAVGFNLQWGYTGLFNAGIAGFFLIGAYTATIAMTPPAPATSADPGHLGGYQLPVAAGAILAMLVSGSVAAVVALPTVRLRADYLAIATLAFAEVVRTIAINLEPITGGTIGIFYGIPRLLQFSGSNAAFFTTATVVGVGAAIILALLLALHFIVESPWGRVLRAVREDEEATMAVGKNTFLFKIQVFAIGGALMGLAGWFSVMALPYLEPSGSFAPAITFSIWVMVIVGGAGNLKGSIVGAFVVYGMEWLSVQLKDLAPAELHDTIPYIRLMIIGVLLIVLIIYRPEGILREKKRVLR